MKNLSTVFAIIWFLIKEIPAFVKAFKKVQRDNKYQNFKEAVGQAYSEYKLAPSLKNLKDLENLQKRK